jgi:hypothetical protein
MWWAIYLDRTYSLRYVGVDGEAVTHADASYYVTRPRVRAFATEAEALDAARAARTADAGAAERFRDFSAIPARSGA